jgi:hypothetical protein
MLSRKHEMGSPDEAFKLLGLGAPFAYAGATYWACQYLDQKVSDEAKQAISNVLKIRSHDPANVSAALVEVFDRIYGRPLLSWKGFRRSALFTMVITLVYLYEIGMLTDTYTILRDWWSGSGWFLPTELWVSLLLNIFTDYLALFAVRMWLNSSRSRPLLALVTGSAIGVAVVFGTAFLRGGIGFYLEWLAYPSLPPLRVRDVFPLLRAAFPFGDTVFLTIPTLAVFVWLPLFAISILLLRLASPITWAVGKTQWFLKDGKEHPLEAIGMVASVIVFGAAVVWRVFFQG